MTTPTTAQLPSHLTRTGARELLMHWALSFEECGCPDTYLQFFTATALDMGCGSHELEPENGCPADLTCEDLTDLFWEQWAGASDAQLAAYVADCERRIGEEA